MTFVWEMGTLVIAILFVLTLHNKIFKQSYFSRHGIKNLTPKLPFIGNMSNLFQKQANFVELLDITYKAFPDEKYVGFYEFTNNIIVIRDADLVKQITLKDFDYFVNHRNFVPDDLDPLFGGHLFVLQDQKWKDMRTTLSPAFTGSKMRMMFSLIDEYTKNYVAHFKAKVNEKGNNEPLEIQLKEHYGTYTTDIIASCAFGIELNSLEDPENPFYLMGKKMSNVTLKVLFTFMCYSLFPKIMRILKWNLMSVKDTNFFRNLVQEAMKNREDNKIVRPDMINLLMEAKKGSLKYETSSTYDDAGFATVEESDLGKGYTKRKWTDDQLTAQVFLFLFAGFDTTSTLLSFLTYEIVANPEIQKKLHEEVDEIKKQIDGELTYNHLQKMKYMDMVVSETLRYWPPGSFVDRKCSKEYQLPPPNKNGQPYTVKVNDAIWIPIKSIHHNPRYYENPDTFDPERFSDENKHKIQSGTFLPFGSGPRNCIGSRFALMEVKAILYHLLVNFQFVKIGKTEMPLKLKKGSIRLEPEKDFWLGMKLRNLQ